MVPSQVKMLLLKQRELYLIGTVTELDEEPSILIENCHEIIECAEYGTDAEEIEKRAHSLEGTHLKVSAKKIDEGEKDYYVYEYIILKPYPKFSAQRDLFLTSDAILLYWILNQVFWTFTVKLLDEILYER